MQFRFVVGVRIGLRILLRNVCHAITGKGVRFITLCTARSGLMNRDTPKASRKDQPAGQNRKPAAVRVRESRKDVQKKWARRGSSGTPASARTNKRRRFSSTPCIEPAAPSSTRTRSPGSIRARPDLDRALAELRAGDTLVIWRLDRLERSLRDLLDIADVLRASDVALRSLSDHIDTATASGRLIYSVLGAVAQFERDVITERIKAGIRAKAERGERIGGRPALTPAQTKAARKMLADGESPAHVARLFGCGRSTLYRSIGSL
jgi:DNA invertase Pin-like site-specific DNA recombinase